MVSEYLVWLPYAQLACFVVTAVATGVAAACAAVLVRRVAYLRGPRGYRGPPGEVGAMGPSGRCMCPACAAYFTRKVGVPEYMAQERTRRGDHHKKL